MRQITRVLFNLFGVDTRPREIEERKQQIKRIEKALFEAKDNWPFDVISVKTAPWWPGVREFGYVTRESLPNVMRAGEIVERFDSLDAMLEKWIGD